MATKTENGTFKLGPKLKADMENMCDIVEESKSEFVRKAIKMRIQVEKEKIKAEKEE